MENKVSILKKYIEEAQIITFFGGAGVSTESGIPDYRSTDGRYTKMEKVEGNPQKILNACYIRKYPEKFFNRARPNGPTPEPNTAHRVLADLEKSGNDIRVLTQNVDGLHLKAGHRFVLELHGNGRTWHCMDCERVYLPEEVERDEQNIPRCYVDQGIVRPSVTYYGENPQPHIFDKAKEVMAQSDLLIISGTSLRVNPAKNLINYFEGDRVVVINKEPLNIRKLKVDLFIQAPVGETFGKLETLNQSEYL